MNVPIGESKGFAAQLWTGTKALHLQAERSGMMVRILRGRATRQGYALMLRNLLPAYIAMEDALERHRESPAVGLFARPETYRAAALAADVEALEGPGWRNTLTLLPEAVCYAEAIAQAGSGDGAGLIAHAYTRYLGDLSGGQIMQGVLAKNLGLGAGELAFYRFDGIADIATFKAEYRINLDRAGAIVVDPARVLHEASEAFRHNMAVSEAVDGLEAHDA